MTEPSYEELKAKLAQLEKEVETKKRSGDLIFKVGEKVASASTVSAASGHPVLRAVESSPRSRR